MQGHFPYYGASGVIDSVDDYLFDGTYLLITEDGNLLSRGIPIAFEVSGKFWVNNHAHVIQPVSEVQLGYLKAYANYVNLEEYVSGTTRPKLTQSALNSIHVPLPPLAEQRRIVAEIEDAVHAAGCLGGRAAAGAGQPEALPGQRTQGRLRGPAGSHRGGVGPLRGARVRTRRRPAGAHAGRPPRPLGVAGASAGEVQGAGSSEYVRPAGTARGMGVGDC